ncbi:MAG: amino acid ABC transporter ATP-binding protein [Deltaproteobacteria bacterium]|nr:amino acid ABC transporter ATP-binding protein [Deltaproteobacteria bacterium]
MIRVQGLCKRFGDLVVLKDVHVHIRKGECVALIGPSGAGKSVFLRSLAMLTPPDTGRIFVSGVDITRRGTDLDRVREKMGMVYQGFHLFQHLNVLDNITLAPRWVKKQTRERAQEKARELLALVGLAQKARSYPRELSGGQQQRIAIARCLAMEPDIMLLDEPTSALDPTMTREVLAIIRKLIKMDLTLLIVTHEMNFAREAADRVLYLDEGGVYEEGTAADIFERPQKEKTRAFIRRLSTFQYEIHSADFDLVSMNAQIEVFGLKYHLTPRQISRIQLVLEELLMEILKSCDADRQPDAALTIAYAPDADEISIDLTYRGENFDPFRYADAKDDLDHLGMVIVGNIVKGREHSFADGQNRISLKF